jgi:hypothetical protein
MLMITVPDGPVRFRYGIWAARSFLQESWATTPDSANKNTLFQFFGSEVSGLGATAGAAVIRRTYYGSKYVDYATNMDDSLEVRLGYVQVDLGPVFFNAEYATMLIERESLVDPSEIPSTRGTFAQTMTMEGTISSPRRVPGQDP